MGGDGWRVWEIPGIARVLACAGRSVRRRYPLRPAHLSARSGAAFAVEKIGVRPKAAGPALSQQCAVDRGAQVAAEAAGLGMAPANVARHDAGRSARRGDPSTRVALGQARSERTPLASDGAS